MHVIEFFKLVKQVQEDLKQLHTFLSVELVSFFLKRFLFLFRILIIPFVLDNAAREIFKEILNFDWLFRVIRLLMTQFKNYDALTSVGCVIINELDHVLNGLFALLDLFLPSPQHIIVVYLVPNQIV